MELIETLIEDCDVMEFGFNDEVTFNVAFPGIIDYIEKVGCRYEDGELVDVGFRYEDEELDDVGVLFVNEYKRVKKKNIKIVEKLYKRKIWPFEG